MAAAGPLEGLPPQVMAAGVVTAAVAAAVVVGQETEARAAQVATGAMVL